MHDGNNILIENNLLEGDYLYGLEVYNRRFTMDRVVIRGNTIIQNPANRVSIDDGRPIINQKSDYCNRSETQMRTVKIENPDDVKYNYQLYQAIGLASNNDYRDLHSTRSAIFEISGNTIQNFSAYKNLVLHSRMLLSLVLRKKMLILSLRSRIMLLSEVMQTRL